MEQQLIKIGQQITVYFANGRSMIGTVRHIPEPGENWIIDDEYGERHILQDFERITYYPR